MSGHGKIFHIRRCPLRKGFTLVELICVIAVITIISIVAYPSYSHYISKDRLKLATQELIQNLKYAKTYAINHASSSVNVLFQSSDELKGYDNYRIYIPSGGSSMTLKQVKLPKGVWICTHSEGSTFSLDNKLVFRTTGNVLPYACTIALKDMDTGKKKYITLTIGFTRIMESSGPL